MAEKKETEESPSEEVPSQAESFEGNKSGASETYDMKDFCPGIRIEAKDFDGKWYPAKVSDVDWTENEILVHFENRNTKFNEWIPMDSSRLRPIQKSVIQQKDVVQFTKGEEVMAVWSSNQKYPAVIQAVLTNDRYDVLFSDGFLKRLKSHKISKLQGESIRSELKSFTDIGTKEERRERKRKINVAELFHINKRPRKKGLVHSKSSDIKTYPVTKSHSKSPLVKKPITAEENKEKVQSSESSEVTPNEEKSLTTTVAIPATKNLVDAIPAAFEVKYLNGQSETWSKQLYQRSEGRTAGKLDIVILNPQGRKFRSRNEIMKYCEENGIIYSHEAFDFSAKGRPKSKSILQTPIVKPESTVEDKEKLSLRKGSKKLPQEFPLGAQRSGVIPPYQGEPIPSENVTPNKVFIGDYEVVIENGKFICPVKICGKHFRRENLLHMHMKHYHPEFSKYLDYTPSVTDLAYARTVGNLDAIEVPPPAPRKVISTEKSEKSVTKTETVRKAVESPTDPAKEPKKSKISENRVENRIHSVKAPAEAVTSALEDGSVEENTQKNKFTSIGPQTRRNTTFENETVPQESKASTVDDTSVEAAAPATDRTVSAQNVLKSSRHHKLHSRKKKSRFQGSFAEHIRKKRFISQDRSRSQNRVGRQQQQPRQQLQQTTPSQTPVSSTIEETNVNTLNQAYTMARYPKPHLNISNEISGKNNLLTSCKSLSPGSKKNKKSKHESESADNETDDIGKNVEATEKNDEANENEKSEENMGNLLPSSSKRSFLAGLLKARKRKRKTLRKRLKKKRSKTLRNSIFGTNQENDSGRNECIEKPDETGQEIVGLSLGSSIDLKTDEGVLSKKVDDLKESLKEDLSETEVFSSHKKSIKLRIKRLNLENMTMYDSSVDENDQAVSPCSTEPHMPNTHSQKENEPTVSEADKTEDTSQIKLEINEEKENCIENEDIKNSPQDFETKRETNTKDLPKSCVLLENICRKEVYLKRVNFSLEGNDENVGSLGSDVDIDVIEKREKGGRKKSRLRKFCRKDRRRLARKKVRFENTVMEKWISADGREEFSKGKETKSKSRDSLRRDDKKKKQRKTQVDDYLVENVANPPKRLDDSSGAEKSFLNYKTPSLDQAEVTEDSKSPLVLENEKVEKLRRNEIINCLCGITEEDGLMIQCDLCLCWQHGHCAGILRELDVPDKYTCAICKNPYRARSSMKYLHDQEWLKEGTLPSLSFRSKRDDIISQRRTILKRSHDLSGSITLLAQVIHSLRIKVNIAEKKDHPKLWLWAKKWTEKKPNRLKEESDFKEERPEEQSANLSNEVKLEGNSCLDKKQLPKAPEPEAPIDSAECRINLLDHLIHYQTLVDARLSCIESLVAELESMQDDVVNDETPDRYPRTKATVQMILRDLNTMKKIATI